MVVHLLNSKTEIRKRRTRAGSRQCRAAALGLAGITLTALPAGAAVPARAVREPVRQEDLALSGDVKSGGKKSGNMDRESVLAAWGLDPHSFGEENDPGLSGEEQDQIPEDLVPYFQAAVQGAVGAYGGSVPPVFDMGAYTPQADRIRAAVRQKAVSILEEEKRRILGGLGVYAAGLGGKALPEVAAGLRGGGPVLSGDGQEREPGFAAAAAQDGTGAGSAAAPAGPETGFSLFLHRDDGDRKSTPSFPLHAAGHKTPAGSAGTEEAGSSAGTVEETGGERNTEPEEAVTGQAQTDGKDPVLPQDSLLRETYLFSSPPGAAGFLQNLPDRPQKTGEPEERADAAETLPGPDLLSPAEDGEDAGTIDLVPSGEDRAEEERAFIPFSSQALASGAAGSRRWALPAQEKRRTVYIGDSRTVGMQIYVGGEENEYWSAKNSMGYSWMVNSGTPAVEDLIGSGTDVVILMGVNDLGNAGRYVDYMNAKAQEWKKRGARTFFVSVTPVVDSKSPNAKNSRIEAFNEYARANLRDVYYIDAYSRIRNSFGSPDGIHFDGATYWEIYRIIHFYLYRGWYEEAGLRFYFDAGRPVTGWHYLDGQWQYMDGAGVRWVSGSRVGDVCLAPYPLTELTDPVRALGAGIR